MNKIIITDMDGTLINGNLERDFLLYFLCEKLHLFPLLIRNISLHFLYKWVSKLLYNKKVRKWFYYNIEKKKLNSVVSSWLLYSNVNKIQINRRILNKANISKVLVLTACPSFIAVPFIKKTVKDVDLIFSTKLRITNGRYNGKVEYKIIGDQKGKIVSKIKEANTNNFLIGYGNSSLDMDFLMRCNSYNLIRW